MGHHGQSVDMPRYNSRLQGLGAGLRQPYVRLSPSEETADIARRSVDQGFTAVKFGWEPMGRTRSSMRLFVRAIRQAVGDEVDVLIDGGLNRDLKAAMER